ncbi:fasciclin domain-containing protein [Marinicauda algicola]|uniref:Fasciclin domain-containing protein n=1 Tax=Marinicauda algicola TaxID=2029849 RepID=A0A4S2H2T7_9PROT|nr:fasciclin domain-containing protein [Marinicauda algicola]TGY89905.1 fasciclin domain-containing protein [Marinicauda algicola]
MRFTALLSTAAIALTAAPALADHHASGDHHQMQADIVDTAIQADGFDTLVAALQAAELVEALKGEGPFTVFAPNDPAFAALPEGTLDTLLQPENKDQLVSVLTYHVVPGEYTAAGTEPGTYELETLQGDTVNVVVNADGSVTVDGASVVAADVDASNGVIHVIDTVILPGE